MAPGIRDEDFCDLCGLRDDASNPLVTCLCAPACNRAFHISCGDIGPGQSTVAWRCPECSGTSREKLTWNFKVPYPEEKEDGEAFFVELPTKRVVVAKGKEKRKAKAKAGGEEAAGRKAKDERREPRGKEEAGGRKAREERGGADDDEPTKRGRGRPPGSGKKGAAASASTKKRGKPRIDSD